MNKRIFLILITTFTFIVSAATPTEEGLLRNLNNASLPGNLITIKTAITKLSETKGDNNRVDYYKFVFLTGSQISMLQVNYSGAQMLPAQTQDIKYIPDLIQAIKKEKYAEKGMFYAVLTMLATNNALGMEAFLEKTGTVVLKNSSLMNEGKIKLLQSYKSYLLSTKGKGEATSPLNPQDPKEKAQVIELFKANTFVKSKNVELVKNGNEFLWKVDWKSVKAFFTNEERRFRAIDYNLSDSSTRIDASEYISFNNNNELPKILMIKDTVGENFKLQVLSEEIKKTQDKNPFGKPEDAKKAISKPIATADLFSFVF